MLSVGFAGTCLGQSAGDAQAADLGDGNGKRASLLSCWNDGSGWGWELIVSLWVAVNQTGLLRWDYGNPSLGTCTETIEGGDHARWWVQNGSLADSGAIFMALSYEMNLTYQHDVGHLPPQPQPLSFSTDHFSSSPLRSSLTGTFLLPRRCRRGGSADRCFCFSRLAGTTWGAIGSSGTRPSRRARSRRRRATSTQPPPCSSRGSLPQIAR